MIKNSTKNHALKEIVLGLSIFVACTLFLISGAVAPKDSGAQSTEPNLTGWAWSDNIGWICFDGDPCGGSVSPLVEILNSNGNLTGYAWSDNIGWVKFGNLSGFPTGSGTVAANAKYDPATKTITGWARACAGTVNGNCSSMTSRTDGWDGWISLKGTNYGLKVSADNSEIVTSTASGDPYAWGSDVVGWVNFSQVGVEGLSNNCTYEGQTILNGSSQTFYSACVDGSRNATNVSCVNGVATPGTPTSESCGEVADCTLPLIPGQTVGTPLGVGAAPVTRYSRSQVRAGESCDLYKAQLDCVVSGEGEEAESGLVTIPPGGNVSTFVYENCRALPSVIER